MPYVNSNYRKNSKAFYKFVNGLIKSCAESKIETLTDDSGSINSNYAGKVKTLKLQYNVKFFDNSWKEELSI